MTDRVVIGSRGSRLALVQAEGVLSQLVKRHAKLNFTLMKIATYGDRHRTTSLGQMPGIGVFVKELEAALLDGRIDIAVHSLKDMPTETTDGLRLAAVMERADPRDILVTNGRKLAELPPGARIGSDSLRRAAQLKNHRPDLEVCSIRGNIDTRLKAVASGQFDGVILAAAALIRLGLQDTISEYLPLEHFLPPPGQGALGIEIRSDDGPIAELVGCLNHRPSYQSVIAERAFLSTLGGGCRAPIAALATITGEKMKLRGMVADADGRHILNGTAEDSVDAAEQLGVQLARKLLKMGASKFIAEVRT
jgi:hydroxymethylbilane synthase